MLHTIRYIPLLALVFFLVNGVAQARFSSESTFIPHPVVTTPADGAMSVFAIDVDGDTDIDVLSASWNDNTIAWYENDGSESFTKHVVDASASGARSVYAIDVDGDTDIDLLSASALDDTIAWYENDGSESFSKHIVDSDADRAWAVFAADVNGDNAIDILAASTDDDTIAWYENDGSESFTKRTLSTTAFWAKAVYAADIDNDGDTDVLGAYSSNKLAWYENDAGSFTEHILSTQAGIIVSVHATDVDGDGDTDLLSASSDDDTIAWFENDGSESFSEHTVSTGAEGASAVYAVDVDGDGDTDILSASYWDNTIAWYENDGNENFSENIVSSTAEGAESVYATDVDGDGHIDILSASSLDGKVMWYEQVPPDPPADPGAIGDFIFIDFDSDGVQDINENAGIAGVVITATNVSTGVVYAAVSDEDGFYLLDDLPPGTYDVASGSLPGITSTTKPQPVQVTVVANTSNLDIDFGYSVPTAVSLASFTATAAADGNLIRWMTASEENQDGFMLWRATRAEGPYAVVADFIPATNDPAGASYEWLDTSAQPGTRYFYKLMSMPDGELFGPVSVEPGPGGGSQQLYMPLVVR